MPWTLADHRVIESPDQLDELGLQQVVVAGKRYDGEDRPAEERLQGAVAEELEGNLMQCDVYRIVDGDTHLYDVWSYMADSGTVFAANTTDAVADVCQFSLECSDPELKAKLEPVLRSERVVRV